MIKPESCGSSFKGLRENNEDNFAIERINDKCYFLAIADGMGGQSGGEIASDLVIKKIIEYLKEVLKEEVPHTKYKELIFECYVIAQESIRFLVSEQTNLEGMGTTLCCALFVDDKYVVGNMGDSRIYRANENKCELLTIDHTYINELSGNGKIPVSAEQVQSLGHILTRALDGGHELPDIFPLEASCYHLNEGELFVLCSDGAILNKEKNNEDHLLSIIEKSSSTDQLVNDIIEDAYNRGSSDNITVAAINFGYRFTPSHYTPSSSSQDSTHQADASENGRKKRNTVVENLSHGVVKYLFWLFLFVSGAVSGILSGLSFSESSEDQHDLKVIGEHRKRTPTDTPVIDIGLSPDDYKEAAKLLQKSNQQESQEIKRGEKSDILKENTKKSNDTSETIRNKKTNSASDTKNQSKQEVKAKKK